MKSLTQHREHLQHFFGHKYPSEVSEEDCRIYIQSLELEILLTQEIIREEKRNK